MVQVYHGIVHIVKVDYFGMEGGVYGVDYMDKMTP